MGHVHWLIHLLNKNNNTFDLKRKGLQDWPVNSPEKLDELELRIDPVDEIRNSRSLCHDRSRIEIAWVDGEHGNRNSPILEAFLIKKLNNFSLYARICGIFVTVRVFKFPNSIVWFVKGISASSKSIRSVPFFISNKLLIFYILDKY